jgi:uncharacterized membrane-anchored protein
MMLVVSALSLLLVAACVFVPVFGIALVMLKSPRRAFSNASMFALGSVAGFWLAGTVAGLAVGHAVGSEFRNAFGIAFVTGGAVAGGVLAVWALNRKSGAGS